jgi:hypothetical protein
MDRQVPGVTVPLRHRGIAEPVLSVGPNRFDAVALGDVTLQCADGDGSVDHASAALVFTGRGADSAADRSERVGGAGDEIGLFLTPQGDELDVAAGVGGDRATRLALDLCLPVFEIGESRRDGHWSAAGEQVRSTSEGWV